MKFRYLKEFIIAAKSSELSQAADELGISLSVLSKHIDSLELELGVPLFVRSRHAVLSQYGRIMLPYAQELVALQNEYLSDFAKDSANPSEVLKIALSPRQFKEKHSLLLETFMLSNPSIPVETVECANKDLEDYVLSSKCDMAFVRTLPGHERNPELLYYPVCVDKMIATFPADHRLASKDSLTFNDLANEKILLRSDNTLGLHACMEGFSNAGISPDIEFVGSFAVYDMVKRGEGISMYLAPSISDDHDPSIATATMSPPVFSYVDIICRRSTHPAPLMGFLEYMLHNTQGLQQS